MVRFCSKCDTAHKVGMACPPRALKAMSEKPAPVPPPAPKADAVAALIESGEVRKGIPMNELKMVETEVAPVQSLGMPLDATPERQADVPGILLTLHADGDITKEYLMPKEKTEFVDRPDCAKCEERRVKNVEAVKRFRAKNGGG